MNLQIITPEKTLFEGEVLLAQFPGIDGSFEIMESHAPMIAILKKGKIRILDSKKEEQFFEINSGIIEVNDNVVQVLAQ